MFGHLVLYYKGVHVDGVEDFTSIWCFILMLNDIEVDADVVILSLINNHQYHLEDIESRRIIDIFYVSPDA